MKAMAGNGTMSNRSVVCRSALIAIAAAALTLSLSGIPGALASDGGGATASRAGKSVDIDNFAYHPPTLRVVKGATVSFVNSSSTAHTATKAGAFSTGKIQPGKSVAVRFAQKGTFAYHCTIHPFMHGKIVVE
ncbi:MAG: cupredoxin domain-containing protein [Solirubrobacterales bacterium]